MSKNQQIEKVMKILLRNARTGRYCGAGGKWVREATVAWDFKTFQTAGRRAIQFDRNEIRIVLHYEQPPCELALAPEFCV
jgi:hypothetical protein